MEEATQTAFQKEIIQINGRIDEIKRLDAVNKRLKILNWTFLHPFSQNYEKDALADILDSGVNSEDQVLSLFAHKFLNLKSTIHFVDGLFKKRPFLGDYANDIEESVILCIQKDFHGAINILLPVIEGTLRKCLIHQKGENKKHEVSIEELMKVMDVWIDQYVDLNRQYLRNEYKYLIAENNYFDQNQEKEILKKRREYFALWMEQLKSYFANNLYLNTKTNVVTDTFNRHVIFHALEDNIDFNFSNYLRLFNCIHYLSWAIGLVNPGCSVLSVANEDEVIKKWLCYMKVLSASEALERTKATIYGKRIESFRPYMDQSYLHVVDRPATMIKDALTILDLDVKDTKVYRKIPQNPFKALIYFLMTKLALKFSPSKE